MFVPIRGIRVETFVSIRGIRVETFVPIRGIRVETFVSERSCPWNLCNEIRDMQLAGLNGILAAAIHATTKLITP
jgi:hypothetical protein